MLRKVMIVLVIAALVVVPGAAIAKKKKIRPGLYPGTTNEGITMSVTLNKDRHTGTVTYCDAIGAPFVLAGKSFQIALESNIAIQGTFSKNGTVSGTIPLSGGCSGSPQTFFIRHQ
jgi:hypothetical protein